MGFNSPFKGLTKRIEAFVFLECCRA